MIVYSLQCQNEHQFEAWFASSAAYEEQAAERKLVCPICNSRNVAKAPMAPALPARGGDRNAAPDELRKMRQFMTGLRQHVLQNAENVGRRFPEEARKIHYGDAERRQIYGEATLREARELVEEGIDVAPLPPDLDEAN